MYTPEAGRGPRPLEIVLPWDFGNKKGEEDRARNKAKDFQDNYFNTHPGKKKDPRLNDFFYRMQNEGYWHVLGHIDGYESESEEQKRERKGWATSNFSIPELTQIAQMQVDRAVLRLHTDAPQPGFSRGHDEIYHHFFERTDTLFKGMLSENLRLRLQNGRFWEMLGELDGTISTGGVRAERVISTILKNHFDELDPQFFSRGYEMFKENKGYKDLSLEKLSDETLSKYFEFVKKIDGDLFKNRQHDADVYNHKEYPVYLARRGFTPREPKKTEEKLADLVSPYIRELATRSRLGGKAATPKIREERFEDPMIQNYLELDSVRKDFAKEMPHFLYDDEISERAAEIISYMPHPREFINRIVTLVRREHPDRMQQVRKTIRRLGLSYANYLGEKDEKVIFEAR